MTAQREVLVGRLQKALRSRALFLGAAVGLVFTLTGAILGISNLVGVALLGIGTSTFASALFAFLALGQDELVEEMRGLGVERIFHNRRVYCTDDFWTELIVEATEHYSVLGVANHGFIKNVPTQEHFEGLFKGALSRHDHLTIKVLWLDPRSELARQRQAEEKRNTRRDILESIDWFYRIKQSIPAPQAKRMHLKLYTETPTCGITWCDDSVIVTHYQAGVLNFEAPGMELSGGGSKRWRRGSGPSGAKLLADAYTKNLRQVEARAKPIDDALLQELRSNRPDYDIVQLPSEADLRQQKEEG